MGNRSVDALQCFSFLADNVPSWITTLDDLVSHTAAKHAEFAAEYARLDSASRTSKLKRRKNSSIHSIRPDESNASAENLRPDTKPKKSKPGENTDNNNEVESYLDPLTLLRVSKAHPREAGAHRRKDDCDTGHANIPNQQPRQRPQVVVHYDSHTQNVLEQLVRDIGGARNNIRKGRMSQMMKTGFGFRAMADDRPRFRDVKSQFNNPIPARAPQGMATGPLHGRKDSPFELADKQLELAQSYCETASHQFLRNGDCASELQKTKERFSQVAHLAKGEVEHLKAVKKEEEEEEEARKKEQEQQQQQKENGEGEWAETEVELLPTKYKKEEVFKPIVPDPDLVVEPDEKAVKAKDVDKNPAGMLTAIEVDDASSSSSISIDITAFRSTRFRS